MSFQKIPDAEKKDFIAKEFLKTRQNFLSERAGDLNTQYELSELFAVLQKDLK